MRRSRALTALLVAFIVALVTACGGGGDDSGSADGGAASGALEGTITVRFMGDPQPIYETFKTEFEEANPGTTIELQQSPWTEAHDQFTTEISGGSVVDVSEMGNTWTREFADLGGLEPLDAPAGGELVPGMVEAATLDGELYGMPWYAGARGLIYRTDVFEQAGIAGPPDTWEDLKAAAEAITAKFNGEPFAFAVAGGDTHGYLPMVWQWGGTVMEEDGDSYTSTMASPEAAEAFDFYKGLYDAGFSPEGALAWNSLEAQEAFATGQVAMMIGGGWDVQQLLETNPDLETTMGTALMPQGPGGNRDTFAGGSHLVVFAESDNKPLAKAFVDFMMEPGNVGRYAEGVPGYFPGNEAGITATAEQLGPLYQPMAEMLLEHTRSYPTGAAWGAIEGAEMFDNTMQAILTGDTPTEDALEELADDMDAEF